MTSSITLPTNDSKQLKETNLNEAIFILFWKVINILLNVDLSCWELDKWGDRANERQIGNTAAIMSTVSGHLFEECNMYCTICVASFLQGAEQ